MDKNSRASVIVRTSLTGIVSNTVLAGLKLAAGMLAGSSAIIADAVNNFSDAASSVVTIAGTKLAAKPADKKHPFGHGRVEYLSSMIVGIIVLYAGLTTFTDAVKSFFNPPEIPSYTNLTLIVILLAIAVKILLSRLFISKGRETKSDSLTNSGKDAFFDSIISGSTLVGVLIFKLFNFVLEPYIAALIAFFIIKAGFEMIKETVSKILGESGDIELAKKIRSSVLSFSEVKGVYDLVLNNYGPDAFSGSVHISVPDTFTAWEIDELIRKIQIKVYEENNVVLNAIGVYSINTKDEEIAEIEKKINDIVLSTPFVNQIHGFHLNREKKQIRFDVVISFDAKDRTQVFNTVSRNCTAAFPDYSFQIAIDTDYFES